MKALFITNATKHFGLRLTAICMLLALCAANLPLPANSQQLTIGIIGDQTGTDDLDTAYQVLQQGVDVLGKQDIDLVLHVGDLVESTMSESQIRSHFAKATSILGQLPVPWYLTAGDHDVNPPKFVQNSTDRSRETLFRELYSGINPLVSSNLYYSFDFRNYHFVVLYSIEHLDTDPRWGNVFYSSISDEQFEWLQSDLASNTAGKDGTIVLIHQPMWYNWTDWARIHAVLAKYGVTAVIAGHFHYNQRQYVLDGINYHVVGATGGKTKTGTPNAGDLQHVSLMSIDGKAAQFRMLPLSPFVQNDWTERNVMDQVQAIDTLMGNIFSFGTNSPVNLENGKLVATCGNPAPAKLVVKDIGNAIARNVNVTVNVTGNNINVTGGTFGAGFCETDIDEFSCLLNESAGVAVSNNSLVQMSQFPPPPPLWTATVEAGSTPPTAGSNITLQLVMSFNQNNQTFTVFQTGTTEIKACQ